MDIMSVLKAVFLGIVQGFTEFLPISSTGHMIIVDEFIKISGNKSFTAAFEVIIQMGTVLSVLVLFWKDLWPFSGTVDEKKGKWLLWAKVAIGVLPAVVLGLSFDKIIEEKLFNPYTVSAALLFYGIILILIEKLKIDRSAITETSQITFKIALLIGLFQCLAMVPGTSRSAATIIGGMILGLSRPLAARFSFFLAIPTIAGATLLKIVKNGLSFTGAEWALIGIGFVTAFIVAAIVIKGFMAFIQKHDFTLFGYYRIILAVLVLIMLMW